MTTGDTETRRRGADFDAPAPPRSFVNNQDEAAANDTLPSHTNDTLPSHATAHGERHSHTSQHSDLTARARARLSQVLIGKSLVETLFVVALLAAFSYTHFNPRLRGTLDAADARAVAGWVVDESAPDSQVEVELYIDDHFVARRRASEPRPDVLAAGRAASAEHGYVFETPPLPAREGEYVARVFAAAAGTDARRRSLVQLGDAVKFSVRPNESNAAAPEKWWESLEKR